MSAVIPSAPGKNPFEDDVLDTDQLRSPTRSPAATPAIRVPGRGPRLRSAGGCSGGSGAPGTGSDAGGGGGRGGCCDRPCCRRCSECCFACTARCTRVLLVVPNILFLLCGATMVGLGVWMRADRVSTFYVEVVHRIPASPVLSIDQLPVAIIAVGSLVAVLSFLGCCGACFESVCFLCLYTLFLTLMVAAEIVVGVVIAFLHEQLLWKLGASLQNQITYDYNRTGRADNASYEYHLSVAWDNMHQQFACCGADGPKDFVYSNWYNRTSLAESLQVPPSCCAPPAAKDQSRTQTYVSENKVIGCQQMAALYIHEGHGNQKKSDPNQHSSLRTQGCKQSVLNQLKHNLWILIGIGCAVVLLQIVDCGFACVLMTWFRKKQAEYPWYEDDDFD